MLLVVRVVVGVVLVGGVVLVVLLVMQLGLRTRRTTGPSAHPHPAAAWTAGGAAGFTTMTANAAGAVMTLYLSAAGVDKRRFVGTNAWFFLVVNLVKVPFSVGLGLISATDVVRALALAPAVVVGGLLVVGGFLVGRGDQICCARHIDLLYPAPVLDTVGKRVPFLLHACKVCDGALCA